MPLTKAGLCKVCGRVRTKDPSGICSRCRKAGPNRSQLCQICKTAMTRNPDGICYNCKMHLRQTPSLPNDEEVLKEALHELKKMQFIIEQRLQGRTFAATAEMMGTTKSSIYKQYQKALDIARLRTFSKSITEDS